MKLLTILIFLFLSAQLAIGQSPPLYIFTGEAAHDFFGFSVSSAGDANNDGFDDLIIGAHGFDAGGSNAGRAYVFSGRTGDTIFYLTGENAGDQFGWSVSSAGDLDNNGYADLIIGAPLYVSLTAGDGRAYVISGLSGGTFFTFTGSSGEYMGLSVSSAGNVDNKFYDDFIIGASRNSEAGANAGKAYVFRGNNGTDLYTFTSEAAGDGFGSSVSSAGDVNNDGFDDLIIGAIGFEAGGSNAGRAYVFSGKEGDTLFVFTGESAGDWFGRSVSSAGDVDNDGFSDIIIGAEGNDVGGSNAGRAYVFSGQTGETLYVFTGEAAGDKFGYSVSTAGDVNGDGFDDVIIGAFENDAGGTNAGRAYVYSGKTGNTLYILTGENAGDGFGLSVSSAGDVDGNGLDDVIIGAYFNDAGGKDAGRAYVYSFCCIGSRGDVNGDGQDATVLDLTYLIDDIFRGGLDSPCGWEADINSDSTPSTILDLTYLIDAIFRGGPAPGPCY